MTALLISVFGFCSIYQAYRFRLAGMHQFALAYSIAVVMMLLGFVFSWPIAARWSITAVAMGLLLVGAYQLRKGRGSGRTKY